MPYKIEAKKFQKFHLKNNIEATQQQNNQQKLRMCMIRFVCQPANMCKDDSSMRVNKNAMQSITIGDNDFDSKTDK